MELISWILKTLFLFLAAAFFTFNITEAQRSSPEEDKHGSRIIARSKSQYRPILADLKPGCGFPCKSSARRMQCGSDGRTFTSKCQARRAKCLDPLLTTKPGRCKGSVCFKARNHSLKKEQSLSTSNSVYIPNCTADGQYAPRQCYKKVGFCWCVTPNGKMVAGSNVQHAKPTCTTGNVRRSTESCSSSKRSILLASIRRKSQREYRKATPPTEVSSSKDVILRLALSWRFSTIDTDQNHELDKRELRLFLKSEHARECVSEFTDSCDADRNKVISEREWTICLFVDLTFPIPSPRSTRQPLLRPNASTTAILNVYHSTVGSVSNSRCLREDQTTLVGSIRNSIMGEHTPTPSLAANERENAAILWKFRQLDRDSNQQVNYKETRRLRRRFSKDNFKECFMEICDSNSDNSLTKTEWESCFRLNKPKPCYEERQEAIQRSGATKNGYVPECEAKNPRYFNQVQCHDTGYCWCTLRETGRLIPGTSTRGSRPNCNRASRTSTLSIPGCKKPNAFISSLQSALVREKLRDRTSTTEERSFSSEVAVWFYRRIDANRDQQVSKKEAKSVRKLLRRKVSSKRCLKKFMRFCDGDSNKRVSQPEFLECLQVSSEPTSESRSLSSHLPILEEN